MFGDPVKNPNGWGRTRLSEVLLKIESGRSPVCLDRKVMPGEWGVLKLGAITKCIYNYAENKALPDAEKPNPDIEIRAGDILFSRKNTYDLVAACAYVWETPPKLMMSDLIFRLKLRDNNLINSIFLQALLSFPSKRKMIQKLAGGAAGSMPNISKAKLLEYKIEVPPYSFQNQFAEIVQKTKTIKQKMIHQSEELEIQFQALMQKAFKGEL
jgi:type I restriction enzyme S subunit